MAYVKRENEKNKNSVPVSQNAFKAQIDAMQARRIDNPISLLYNMYTLFLQLCQTFELRPETVNGESFPSVQYALHRKELI